jgi:hypothetical protein
LASDDDDDDDDDIDDDNDDDTISLLYANSPLHPTTYDKIQHNNYSKFYFLHYFRIIVPYQNYIYEQLRAD